MDYETHPTNRMKVRLYAKMFRQLFGLSLYGSVNPIMLLDKVNNVFPDVDYEIVGEAELPKNVPARCIVSKVGSFIIQIADYVFEGAYERNIGGYRMHIMHEIIHPYVYKLGFTPIKNKSIKNKKIPAFKSVEWIVKAMAGEVMMPYEETSGLKEKDLMIFYGVSPEAALKRTKY